MHLASALCYKRKIPLLLDMIPSNDQPADERLMVHETLEE